ncbi:MAG TPA: hypothetical protein VGF99_02895 [Myxococcota bacterium]
MLHRRHLLAALLLSTSTATTSVAQTPATVIEPAGDDVVEAPVEVRFHKSTTIDITAAPIEGTRQGPRLTRINGRKKAVFSPMIPMRTSFRDALSSSSAAL